MTFRNFTWLRRLFIHLFALSRPQSTILENLSFLVTHTRACTYTHVPTHASPPWFPLPNRLYSLRFVQEGDPQGKVRPPFLILFPSLCRYIHCSLWNDTREKVVVLTVKQSKNIYLPRIMNDARDNGRCYLSYRAVCGVVRGKWCRVTFRRNVSLASFHVIVSFPFLEWK